MLHNVLQEHFGFTQFRPGQAEVIEHLLAGRSAAAVFPTGSGKSLCYQLPALLLPGLTLVVSPLIALMKDQIDHLQQRGIAAARLDSTLNAEQTSALMQAVRAGQMRLLYVAPERFNNERFREALGRLQVSLFAVDEAHCISEWGHNFRPDYLKLVRFARQCGAERLLALTATATPQVLADICQAFAIAPACAIRTGFYRPNLTVLTTPVSAAERHEALRQRLTERAPGATIVYVTLQRTAEEVARELAAAGFPARAYHAGLADAERAAVQEWFQPSAQAVVVATIAFGMGIDKADIRYVYHYNLPKSLENFSQEIGRAGRDGQPSTCEMLVCPDDLNALENFAYGDTPAPEAVQSLVHDLFAQGDTFDVSLIELAGRHDIRPLVLRTLLTYLELEGYLEEGTPFYAQYRFRPLATSADILSRFTGERRAFLAKVLAQAKKARIWFDLDLEQTSKATGASRERLVRALDYLGEQQLLDIQVAGLRQRFRRLCQPTDMAELVSGLHQRTLQRESNEIARLQQVVHLVGHNGCQVSWLGTYFGEPLPHQCGHCSWCLSGGVAVPTPVRAVPSIDATLWQQITQLRTQRPEPLAHPRVLARFACGLSSPHLSRAKLTTHPLFGSLAQVPFAQVLARAEQWKHER